MSHGVAARRSEPQAYPSISSGASREVLPTSRSGPDGAAYCQGSNLNAPALAQDPSGSCWWTTSLSGQQQDTAGSVVAQGTGARKGVRTRTESGVPAQMSLLVWETESIVDRIRKTLRLSKGANW